MGILVTRNSYFLISANPDFLIADSDLQRLTNSDEITQNLVENGPVVLGRLGVKISDKFITKIDELIYEIEPPTDRKEFGLYGRV